MVHRRSMAMLDNIVTMHEYANLFYTTESMQQSRQWLPKGQPCPVKAKEHAARTKRMVLVFFYFKSLIYTNYIHAWEDRPETRYIVDALGWFMIILKKKRPAMVVDGFTGMMPQLTPTL
jgi:hypothetical protein